MGGNAPCGRLQDGKILWRQAGQSLQRKSFSVSVPMPLQELEAFRDGTGIHHNG